MDCSLQASPRREVPTYLDQSEIKVSSRHREIGVDASIGWGRLRWMVTSKKPVDVKKE